jgi:hypothetical protein
MRRLFEFGFVRVDRAILPHLCRRFPSLQHFLNVRQAARDGGKPSLVMVHVAPGILHRLGDVCLEPRRGLALQESCTRGAENMKYVNIGEKIP